MTQAYGARYLLRAEFQLGMTGRQLLSRSEEQITRNSGMGEVPPSPPCDRLLRSLTRYESYYRDDLRLGTAAPRPPSTPEKGTINI